MLKAAPRIHVLLARDASTGLVIRRGPSKCVATIHWDRKTDEFHLGQWMKGRIYERRSDLSPDGNHFIYFAMNGKWSGEAQGSWTAISQAPYLKAITLFPKGDCWQGGGLWTSNQKYWLNQGYHRCENTTPSNSEIGPDENFRLEHNFGFECPGVYYPRLMRDGWKLKDRTRISNNQRVDVFEKQVFGVWCLQKLAHRGSNSPQGKGCYWDEHVLLNEELDIRIPKPGWEWADIDGERLVWAAEGKLFAGVLGKRGLLEERELYDFSSMHFKPIAAPY